MPQESAQGSDPAVEPHRLFNSYRLILAEIIASRQKAKVDEFKKWLDVYFDIPTQEQRYAFWMHLLGAEDFASPTAIEGTWGWGESKGSLATGWTSTVVEYVFNSDFTYTRMYRFESGQAYTLGDYSMSRSSDPETSRDHGTFWPLVVKGGGIKVLFLPSTGGAIVSTVARHGSRLIIDDKEYKK